MLEVEPPPPNLRFDPATPRKGEGNDGHMPLKDTYFILGWFSGSTGTSSAFFIA